MAPSSLFSFHFIHWLSLHGWTLFMNFLPNGWKPEMFCVAQHFLALPASGCNRWSCKNLTLLQKNAHKQLWTQKVLENRSFCCLVARKQQTARIPDKLLERNRTWWWQLVRPLQQQQQCLFSWSIAEYLPRNIQMSGRMTGGRWQINFTLWLFTCWRPFTYPFILWRWFLYSEILLLGNLLTITQGGGETLETMTFADKIVVMMWQVMMAIKLTGNKLKGIR